MKRLFTLLIATIIIFSFCGCSQYKCRDEVKKFGESAVFYAEQYINGVISAEEAWENLVVVTKDFDEYIDIHNDDLDSATVLCENNLDMAITILMSRMLDEDLSGGKISDIKDSVEDIKKYISY